MSKNSVDARVTPSSIKSKDSWNKNDLTILLASEANIPKVRAAKYINIVTDTIAEALEQGKKVTLSDFGTFQISERRSFAGHNPKTGDPLHVPVRKIPVFRAGKKLKQSLNIPQVKTCTLIDSNKVRVVFSKLMREDHVDFLQKSTYEIFVDAKKIGTVTDVSVDSRGNILRAGVKNTEVSIAGVESIILTCSANLLRGSELSVKICAEIADIDGNMVEL